MGSSGEHPSLSHLLHLVTGMVDIWVDGGASLEDAPLGNVSPTDPPGLPHLLNSTVAPAALLGGMSAEDDDALGSLEAGADKAATQEVGGVEAAMRSRDCLKAARSDAALAAPNTESVPRA